MTEVCEEEGELDHRDLGDHVIWEITELTRHIEFYVFDECLAIQAKSMWNIWEWSERWI